MSDLYGVCTVEGCDKGRRDARHCAMHRNRLSRTGSLELWPRPPKPPCKVDGCDGIGEARGMCMKHLTRYYRTGQVGLQPVVLKPNPSYRAVHSRIERARGKAREHECVDCGKTADQWSYNGNPETALVSSFGALYSPDVSEYEPRCHRCHKAFDHPKRESCPHGHPYSGANLIRKADGSRACKECKKLSDAVAYRKRRALETSDRDGMMGALLA